MSTYARKLADKLRSKPKTTQPTVKKDEKEVAPEKVATIGESITIGKAVTIYDTFLGAPIRKTPDGYMVSFNNGSDNLLMEVPTEEIKLGDTKGILSKIDKRNKKYEQQIEKEDEGCEGGACKI